MNTDNETIKDELDKAARRLMKAAFEHPAGSPDREAYLKAREGTLRARLTITTLVYRQIEAERAAIHAEQDQENGKEAEHEMCEDTNCSLCWFDPAEGAQPIAGYLGPDTNAVDERWA